MLLLKVYDIATGDYMKQYISPIVPKIGETLFIGELQVKVANVCHIIDDEFREGMETHDLVYIELEVEVLYNL